MLGGGNAAEGTMIAARTGAWMRRLAATIGAVPAAGKAVPDPSGLARPASEGTAAAGSPQPATLTRREKFFGALDLRHAVGIEIGPLTTPIVSKQESEVYYVDHTDRDGLRAKYATDPNVDKEKIVETDAIWGSRTLRECFADGRLFDYVIASHVIEHVPDMLGWLHEIGQVLSPSGELMLAIPDKRYTFDILRQPSRLSEVIDAYLQRYRRPMPAQLFDYNVNSVEVDMVAAWNGTLDMANLKHYVNARYALDRSTEAVRDGAYIDAHCWVFTANTLLRLLAYLVDLDLLPYRCARFFPPERNTNEMILVLAKQTGAQPGNEAARESFLREISQPNPTQAGQWAANSMPLPQARPATTARRAR
jgi:SAM-dependent methyltransferase